MRWRDVNVAEKKCKIRFPFKRVFKLNIISVGAKGNGDNKQLIFHITSELVCLSMCVCVKSVDF